MKGTFGRRFCLGAVAAGVSLVSFADGFERLGGCEPVEYIYGDGVSAWYETDYVPQPQTDRIVLDATLPELNANLGLWCSRDATDSQHHKAYMPLYVSGVGLQLLYGDAWTRPQSTALAGLTRYSFELYRNQLRWTHDGVPYTLTASANPNFLTAGGAVDLSAAYGIHSEVTRSACSSQKIHSFRVYRDGVLIHNCLPVRDANGAVRLEHWNHRNFAVMCPKWKPWQETLQVAPVTLIDKYGVTCVYMDQIACATGVPCFSTEHGHVPGSGTPFWVDGYRETLSAIHAETSKRGVPLTSEGLGEMYLDCFDGYLSAEMPRPEDVPLFQAVYSGYATVFGSNLGKYAGADSLFAVSARATIWGVAPGWNEAWIVDKGYEKHAEGLYACARVRQAASEFLARGFLERDVKFLEDPGTTPVAWSSKRGSKDLDVTGTMPAVMGAKWRNVAGTAEAIALVNVSGYAKTVSFRVPEGGAYTAMKLPGQPDVQLSQAENVVRLRILPHTFAVLKRDRNVGDLKPNAGSDR